MKKVCVGVKEMKKKETYQRQIYFTGPGTYDLIEQAETICKRENISFNQLDRQALEEYVQRHGKGNHSFQLDKYGVTWTKAIPVTKCCFKNCKTPATALGFRRDIKQTVAFCTKHYFLVQDRQNGVPTFEGAPLYTELKMIDATKQQQLTTAQPQQEA
jgi:hypothetical protein